MQITNVTFASPFEESDPIWVLRIEVEGSEFLHRAAPVVARVGDVRVEWIIVNMDGDGFAGFLRTFPPVGAELKVGYADSNLIETGFTYDPPIA
jgi:hypothetical protein